MCGSVTEPAEHISCTVRAIPLSVLGLGIALRFIPGVSAVAGHQCPVRAA